MANQYRFTTCTKDYLTRFYAILDEMIKGMDCAQLNDSISHNFIVQMIPHHRAAIEMSRNVLMYTTNNTLRGIASNIITMQTQSIQDMENVLPGCCQQENDCQDLALYQRRFNEITHVMFHEMGTACSDNNISANFMREMIPHHRGAVRMCENALHFCICPGLVPILEEIISSQTRGIAEMQQLLNCITQ